MVIQHQVGLTDFFNEFSLGGLPWNHETQRGFLNLFAFALNVSMRLGYGNGKTARMKTEATTSQEKNGQGPSRA
jgi:hypothetical protein